MIMLFGKNKSETHTHTQICVLQALKGHQKLTLTENQTTTKTNFVRIFSVPVYLGC